MQSHRNLLYDAKGGNASLSSQLQYGEEVSNQSGIYFADMAMYLQRADASKPLIRYQLTPEDASSMATCSVFERVMRVLCGAQKKTSYSDWESAIDAYLTSVQPLMSVDRITESEEGITYAGQVFQGKRYVLILTGNDAYTVYRGLIGLMQEDAMFAGLFNYSELDENDNSLQTGIQKHIVELDALTKAEIDAFKLTFECEQADSPTGIRINAATGERHASLRMLNFQQEELREFELSFYGFDNAGSSLTESRILSKDGSGKYEGSVNYQLLGAGGEIQESISANTKDTINNDGRSGEIVYDMFIADISNLSKLNLSASLSYTVTSGKNNTGVSAQGNININVEDEEEETNVVSFSAQVDQVFTEVSIQSPVFLEGSSVDVMDSYALFDTLEMETTPVEFANAPVSVRGLAVALLSFF